MTMKVSGWFDDTGGTLMASGTGVKLEIPHGAIPEGENKEIFLIVYENLEIDLGPSGTTFQKPVKVTFQNGPHESPNDINFQFCEGWHNKDSIWIDAAQADSNEDAEEKAINDIPNVSYFASNNQTSVYYSHFTGGRKESRKPEKGQFEATVYANPLPNAGISLCLSIHFCKDQVESLEMFQKRQRQKGRTKVAANDRQLIVYNNDNPIHVQMNNKNKSWELLSGKDAVDIPADSFFDPAKAEIPPEADYVFRNENNNSEDLLVVEYIITQIGNPMEISMNVLVSKAFCRPSSAASSGYHSRLSGLSASSVGTGSRSSITSSENSLMEDDYSTTGDLRSDQKLNRPSQECIGPDEDLSDKKLATRLPQEDGIDGGDLRSHQKLNRPSQECIGPDEGLFDKKLPTRMPQEDSIGEQGLFGEPSEGSWSG